MLEKRPKNDNAPSFIVHQKFLYLSPPQSSLCQFFEECQNLFIFEPLIIKHIEADLDYNGKKKKKLRIRDRIWIASHTKSFAGMEDLNPEIKTENLKLSGGCPRMDAHMVYIFLMLRGYYGGTKNKDMQLLLMESKSIELMLSYYGIKNLPGLSTISENINAVSNETRQFIFDAQIRMIINESLDNFSELTIDSTSVKANSVWPKDSELLTGLVCRTFHRGKQLHKFGMTDMSERRFPTIIKTLKQLNKGIQLSIGKPKGKCKRKRLYRKLLRECGHAHKAFVKEMKKINKEFDELDIAPSQRQRLIRLLEWIEEDLLWMPRIMEYCAKRIDSEELTPSKDKKLSLSDRTAGYIKKGNREEVIGYKPQVCRSKNGFIPGLRVPHGNAADSAEFPRIAAESMERTGVIPEIISVDDGYANKKVREELLTMGVKIVSISGSKGKKIIGEEDWESEEYILARNNRSAIESLMFTIKYGFDFGQVRRRGLKNVTAELLEKVLAYNTHRIVEMRKQKFQERISS